MNAIVNAYFDTDPTTPGFLVIRTEARCLADPRSPQTSLGRSVDAYYGLSWFLHFETREGRELAWEADRRRRWAILDAACDEADFPRRDYVWSYGGVQSPRPEISFTS